MSEEDRLVERAPVATIVVGWNSAAYLEDCLKSVLRLRRPPAEIFYVDSGSQDDSVEIVRSGFPLVQRIECEKNVGFCRANNLGIRATRSPFVLVLNPDTQLDEWFLERLLPAFEDPRVGIAAGKLLRFDRRTLDSCGLMLGRSRQPKDRGYGRLDRGRYDRDAEVFGACGAAALYRRAMLEAIADPGECFFDETFFAFYEDLDLAWRARRRGWRAVYRHRALGYHARGGSATRPARARASAAMLGRSPEVRFHITKNRYLTILRNDAVAGYLKNLPFIWARDAATLLLLLLASPGVLVRLWRGRSLFRRALELRRLDAVEAGHQVEGEAPGR